MVSKHTELKLKLRERGDSVRVSTLQILSWFDQADEDTAKARMYRFFETFKERNIFKDDQLAELVERAKTILGGQSAESIRSNDQVKEQIKAGMEDVEKTMAEILSIPRRKIIMN